MKDFFEKLKETKNIEFTDQQKKALLHREGPALVLAVPGAGKTTVLISRVAYLINVLGINPKEILSLTFSRAAARDMKKRFIEINGTDSTSAPHFSTIHSFAHQVVKKELSTQGIEYHFIEGKNAPIHKLELLKQIYSHINKKGIKEETLEDLANAISFVKNRMISPKDIKQENFEIKSFPEIYGQYEKWKREKRYIDFDDMLTLAYGILRKNTKLLQQYRSKYTYIQMDEGQDTSPIQYALLRLLVHSRQNLFIVADDDQSIYGFRGADPKELLDFKKLYPQGQVFYMEENFRSTQSIVAIANQFIQTNQNRYHKNLHTQKEMGSPILVKRSREYKEQIDYLIEELKSKDPQCSTAILFRNHLSAVGLVDQLLSHDISFYLREGKRYFFHHWLTRDILNFLYLALDHEDGKSFEGIYYKMNQYISKKNVDLVKKKSNNQSVFDVLKNSKELPDFQRKRMAALEEKFFILSTLTPIKALKYIEEHLNYGKFLQERKKTRPSMVSTGEFILTRLKNIAENTSTLIEFLCRMEEIENWMKQCSKQKENSSAILLSTLHGAKGLEFDRVYMIDLVEDQIPTYASIKQWERGDIGLLEEERRLFYVGMTRAKKELTLLSLYPSKATDRNCSQFVEEVQACIKNEIHQNQANPYFKVQDKVQHKLFGPGKIQWIQDNTVAIDFENHGVKKLAADFCMYNGILEKMQSI